MKHLNQRLMAGFLSVWMLFASCVSSLAVETFGYSTGIERGEISLEAPLPEKPVRIQLPVVPEESDMFDLIMDPSGVIKASGGGRYALNGSAPDFGPGRVFFKNADESGTVSYSRNSDQLVITNAGMAPLEVSLSVTVNQGDMDFAFAATPNFTDANGNAINKPAAYLALASEKVISPIQSHPNATNDGTVTDATIKGWIPPNDEQFELVWKDGKYQYQLKEGVTADDLNRMYFYMTGALNFNDAWSSVSRSDFSMTVAWDVAHAKGADKDPYANASRNPTVTLLECPTSKAPQATLAVDYGYGRGKMSAISGFTYRNSQGNMMNVEATGFQMNGDLLTFTVTNSIMEGSDWQMIFMEGTRTFLYPFTLSGEPMETSPDPTSLPDSNKGKRYVDVTTAVSAVNGSATVTVNFLDSRMTTVKSLLYYKSGSYSDSVVQVGSNLIVSENTVTIKANSYVFNGSNWRLVLTNDSGETDTTLSFDIKKVGSYPNGASNSGDSGNTESNTPSSGGAYVDVTTAVAAANEFATLSVNFGNGGMNTVTGLVYNKSGYTTDTTLKVGTMYVQTTGNAVTVKAIPAVFGGSNWRLALADDNGNTVLTPSFDIKTVGSYPNGIGGGNNGGNSGDDGNSSSLLDKPIVKVTSAATAANSFATVEITNWASMDTVVGLVYNKSGAIADTTLKAGTMYVQVSGDTVTIKAITAVFNGSNWRLSFSNASGETVLTDPFDLKSVG